MPGKETSVFGAQLEQFVANEGLPLQVFYDHGDQASPNVGKIYGYVGSKPSRKTNLAEVDVMVVNENNEVVLLIEIEEEASLGPKKILGVLMAVLLSEKFSFKGTDCFPTPNTVFICGGTSNPAGYNAAKIRDEIQPRVRELSKANAGIEIQDVRYVLEATVGQQVDAVFRKSKDLLRRV